MVLSLNPSKKNLKIHPVHFFLLCFYTKFDIIHPLLTTDLVPSEAIQRANYQVFQRLHLNI